MGGVFIIGWGSLIWDLEVLAPHVSGAWSMGGGPRLPLEFSRISPKRLGSLVVIADPARGRPCPTHVIASTRAGAAAAADDLAARERAPLDRIGVVDMACGLARGANADTVRSWCISTGARGAVWTDLPANFEAETGSVFTVAAGIAYLKTLEGASLAEAVRYINSAPAETDTPLRRALSLDPWWCALS